MLGEMGYDEQQLRLENARLKEEVFQFLYMLLFLSYFLVIFVINIIEEIFLI